MYQHCICVGFNPVYVIIGSDDVLPILVGQDMKYMANTIDVHPDALEAVQQKLCNYAMPLYKDVSKTELLPMRDINHMIHQ